MTHNRTTLTNLLSLAMDGGDSSGLSDDERESLGRLKSMILTLQSDADDPVPAPVIERGKALHERLPHPVSWLDRAVAFVMNPLMDSIQQPQLGLRGQELRQCTFEIDGYRLDLEISQPTPGSTGDELPEIGVRGQLDSEQVVPFPLRLALIRKGTSASVLAMETTDDGRFDFTAPSGSYELAFEISKDKQMIGSIELP